VLSHRNKKSINPLDLDQWDFYILPAMTLDEKVGGQKTITLTRLITIGAVQASYGEIKRRLVQTMKCSLI
jgi:hypothetical protein